LFALAGRKRQSNSGGARAGGPRAVTATDLRAAQLGRVFDAWSEELSQLGGVSAETDIAALGNTVLDLTGAHPSGIAQLYAGRPTALRSLVRDKAAYQAALAKTEAVKKKADLHAAKYGLPPTHLGLGIAFWAEQDPLTGAAVPRRVPVMLRPIALQATPRGIDLQLEASLTINPVLIQTLTAQGIPIDPEAMARDAVSGTSFNPAPVFDAIRAMGQAVFDDFRVKNKLIVGVFEHPGKVLADDLAASRETMMLHPVVAALAGDLEARSQLARTPLPAPLTHDRPPDHERGVGDLNVAQFHILDVVAAGTSVLLDGPAGAPRAATVAALVADAVGSGRTVLYVSGDVDAKRAVAKNLRAFGLGDCLQDLEPSPNWRERALAHLVRGLRVEAPAVDTLAIGQIRGALEERGAQLAEYMAALHDPLPEWGASPFEALEALAQITEESPATRTACQLDRAAVTTLVGPARERAKTDLRRITELGFFRLTEDTTAWLGADVTSEETARDLLEALDRLRDGSLSRTIAHMRDVTGRIGLDESTSITGWGAQLAMLRGVREALDQFIPEIFERSPEDMVAATATPEWRAANGYELSSRARRRLRKQAKDLIRPGMQISDLHGALEQVLEQRDIWLSWSPTAPWPKLPTGMRQIDAEFEAVRSDLDALDRALPKDRQPLSDMAFSEVLEALDRLNQDRDSLDFLPEISQLTQGLATLGLSPLLEDLAARRVGPEEGATDAEAATATQAVVLEIDFAWWSSLLSWALKDHPILSQMSGEALSALVDSYRELDIAHTATKSLPIRATQVALRKQAAEAYPAQAFKLSHLDQVTSCRQALAMAPELGFAARPCVLAGPVMVPQSLPLSELGAAPLDLVVIDSADALTPALAAAALARGRQAVVIGDVRRTAGAGGSETLTQAAAEFLPHVPLPAESNMRDPRVTALLEEQGYATLGPPVPCREHAPRITWTHIDQTGQVAGNGTRIDAPAAEVEAAVALVEAHLTRWPSESLAVFTALELHATRVRAALEHAAKGGNQLLARALSQAGPAPLLIAPASQAAGVSRDAVILAPGLARSPRGAIIYEFGDFAGEVGSAPLTDVLVAGRRRLTVVSSLRAEDLDEDRLRGSGPRLLRDVLMAASHPKALPASGQRALDPLFKDLARRIERRGTQVTANYGPPDGTQIKLAVRPDSETDCEVVAVLTDDSAFMAEPSMRARIRFTPAALERAGWRVAHAWTAPVFMEPETQARQIAKSAFAKT
jgi:hypothetical protein